MHNQEKGRVQNVIFMILISNAGFSATVILITLSIYMEIYVWTY